MVYGPRSPWPRPMARMVDISKKPDVPRRAIATGEILLRPATIRAIRGGKIEKGDPIRTAEVAALQAVKRVWEALPHTHPIPITGASAEFDVQRDRVVATCEASATYKTGVEMEALYAVAVALLAGVSGALDLFWTGVFWDGLFWGGVVLYFAGLFFGRRNRAAPG